MGSDYLEGCIFTSNFEGKEEGKRKQKKNKTSRKEKPLECIYLLKMAQPQLVWLSG